MEIIVTLLLSVQISQVCIHFLLRLLTVCLQTNNDLSLIYFTKNITLHLKTILSFYRYVDDLESESVSLCVLLSLYLCDFIFAISIIVKYFGNS